MKSVLLLLAVVGAALFSVASADASNAQKQHDVNYLLWKVNENLRDETHKTYAKTFDPEADTSHYSDNGEAVHRLMKELKDHRLLEQKHWFSLFNERQREEALMLFDVFMHCKDWETIVKNAAFFRERMNEGEFVYAVYAGAIHHPLAEHVVLPPLYEVTPHMFTNTEVIQEAYAAKMRQTPTKIKSSFTGTARNKEQRVAYFGEDIGMNTHHVFWHLEFPFWWRDSYSHKLDRKGENFFWVHNQLAVRFDAERISNYLEPVQELHWEKPIHDGFAPHTSYKYGGAFPSRPDDIHFEDVDGVARVRDMVIYESRIRDAIAHGYIIKEDGTHIDIMNERGVDILGDIIESSLYSPNVQYYGALHNTAHIMLGRQTESSWKIRHASSVVMEHFETATRDPGFFRLHKYMDNIFREHKDSLPSYSFEDLDFKGVEVTNVAIDGKLETYFEDFEYSLINAVDDTEDIPDVDIDTYVPRLNHKEFSYNIDIKNDKGADTLATVRIYIWPHKDNNGVEFSFDDARWQAIELDKFWVKLSAGDNHIVRKSTDSSVTVADVPSFKTLMEKTEAALSSGGDLDLHEFESAVGVPNRFLLPKGNENGVKFDLYVCVTDGEKDAAIPDIHTKEGFMHYGSPGVYPDKRHHGYPFDRHVDDERIFRKGHQLPSHSGYDLQPWRAIHHHD
uniref:HcL2 n=1 Tax=Palaemon carinicauda TaxID=392227 RepID=A0A3S8XFU1_PALCI|nr:HcL2 [Palaemon carinicauda]